MNNNHKERHSQNQDQSQDPREIRLRYCWKKTSFREFAPSAAISHSPFCALSLKTFFARSFLIFWDVFEAKLRSNEVNCQFEKCQRWQTPHRVPVTKWSLYYSSPLLEAANIQFCFWIWNRFIFLTLNLTKNESDQTIITVLWKPTAVFTH